MLESRSARCSKTSRISPGLQSRSPLPRLAREEKSMSRFSWLAIALGLLVVLGSVALVEPPQAEAQKKVLNIAAKEPDTLDPHSSTLGQSQAISRFMFRGPTRFATNHPTVTTPQPDPPLHQPST